MRSPGTSVELRSCVQRLEQEVGGGFRRAVRVQRDGGERSRLHRVNDNGLAAGRAATVSEPDRVHCWQRPRYRTATRSNFFPANSNVASAQWKSIPSTPARPLRLAFGFRNASFPPLFMFGNGGTRLG